MVRIEGNDFPDSLYYHREHMWIKIEGSIIRVGYNDWAQQAAGKILNLKARKPGAIIEAGKTLGSIESGKWVGSLKIPISGELIQMNEEVLKDPSLINKDPYGKGWVALVKPTKITEELKTLIPGNDKPALEVWLKDEKAKNKK